MSQALRPSALRRVLQPQVANRQVVFTRQQHSPALSTADRQRPIEWNIPRADPSKTYTHKLVPDRDGELWNIFTKDRIQLGPNMSFLWLFVYFGAAYWIFSRVRRLFLLDEVHMEVRKEEERRRQAGRDINVSFFGPIPHIPKDHDH